MTQFGDYLECNFIDPVLHPQRRKYVIFGVSLTIVVSIVLIIVFCTNTYRNERFVLEDTPFFAGRMYLPPELQNAKYDLTKVDLGKNFEQLKTTFVSSMFWIAKNELNKDCTSPLSNVLQQVDAIKRLTEKYSSDTQLINHSEDIVSAFNSAKAGSMILVDGVNAIGNVAVLRMLKELGVTGVTLSSGCASTPTATKNEKTDEELAILIKMMNNLGMIIDVANLDPGQMKTAINTSKAPVIISNTAASTQFPFAGNIDDDVLELVAQKNGLIMITFDTQNYGSSNISTVIDHINYMAGKIHYDNIAIGGNYNNDPESKPTGYENISTMKNFFSLEELTKNWSKENLEKLAGQNFQRVFEAVEKAQNSTAAAEAA